MHMKGLCGMKLLEEMVAEMADARRDHLQRNAWGTGVITYSTSSGAYEMAIQSYKALGPLAVATERPGARREQGQCSHQDT